ncbi:hypothetical protein [Goodfellowiella coeruleoviolacea]|uniref:Uncharacterized protein n=1 Tax=Goodfellowiella coeruleoviolacea TaxID=334858 RepID=A0AAE3KJD9_9PSEU|nr:hypothetical protein [Goodfellowiella coeruleoviolacea]MCP2170151.1 hypothetical protein [Goodfellowiella coeruleoviolacea]
MHGDQAGQGFQIEHAQVSAAARELPNQGGVLRETAKTLEARPLAAGAFGALPEASQFAATAHGESVARSVRGLVEKDRQLIAIAAGMLDVSQRFQQHDEAVAAKVNELVRGKDTAGEGWLQWGQGGASIVASEDRDYIRLTPRDPSVPGSLIPNIVGAKGFEVGPWWDLLDQEHTYRRETPTPFRFDDVQAVAGEAIRTDPVPNATAGAATPSGARIDADGGGNYVYSFTYPSPDPSNYTDLTINYTVADEHILDEGYVIRYGRRAEDGSLVLVSYGEGNSWLQHPLNKPLEIYTNSLWDDNHDRVINQIITRLDATRGGAAPQPAR